METTEVTQKLIDGGTLETEAAQVVNSLANIQNHEDAIRTWTKLSQHVLTPQHDFKLHLELYRRCFQLSTSLDQPVWTPSPISVDQSNISRSQKELGLASYADFHRWSIEDRESFWRHVIRTLNIRFDTPYDSIVDDIFSVSPSWLVGGRMNIVESCFNSLSDHSIAIRKFIPKEGDIGYEEITYEELRRLAARVANGLIESGTEPGDAIGIVMPMTPTAIAIYLGIIAAGCVVVSVADSFASQEIELRFQIANVRRVFVQDFVEWGSKRMPVYEKILTFDCARAIVVTNHSSVNLRAGDEELSTFLSNNSELRYAARKPDDTIQILFSSGTTAEPKAIPWDHTTPIKCAMDAYFHHNLQPGDVTCWPTSLGWMMGPWLIFASLINRCTIATYPQAPTDENFGRFVQNARVTMLGVVPSLVRTWRQRDCMRQFDWSGIKAFSSTGECSNPEDMFYPMHLAKYRPVIEYCGGTEIGGGYVTGTVVQPCIPSTFSTPALGIDLLLIGDGSEPAAQGEVYLRGASIGLSSRLLNRDHTDIYFGRGVVDEKGVRLRQHGDELCRMTNGYFRVVGRSDDTMNLGGIKVGCAEIERVVNRLTGVMESAAIACSPPEGGPSRLILFLVLKSGVDDTAESLKPVLQKMFSSQLNPLFHISEIRIVSSLPRTESNKIMRRKLRSSV